MGVLPDAPLRRPRAVGYTMTCIDMWHRGSGNMGESAIEGLLGNDDVVYEATQIFDALSDFTRFQILGELAQGEKSVSEIQESSSEIGRAHV